jgi:Tfp pilus assembly protein PilF
MTTTHSFPNNGLQRALFKRPFLSLQQQQQQQRAISRQSPRVNASSDASFPLGSVELSTTTTEAPASVPRWGRVTREEADGSGSSSPLDDRAPPPPPRAPSAPLKINTDLRLVRVVFVVWLSHAARERGRRIALEAGAAHARCVRAHNQTHQQHQTINQSTIKQKQYRARLARMMAYMARDVGERRRLLRDAEAGLRRCLASDPTDARPYVALGRILLAQKRYDEARALYADGCANTGNANPYIWASWGYLEARAGNVSRARKLFDAAVVVDETHAAAWHKWGMLEMRQGNFLRARCVFLGEAVRGGEGTSESCAVVAVACTP